MEGNAFKLFAQAADLCKRIRENNSDISLIEELKELLCNSPQTFVNGVQKVFIGCFFPYIEAISKDKSSVSVRGKHLLVEALNDFFTKVTIEHTNIFMNFYTFLLLELYDYGGHKVLSLSEEYKVSLLVSMTSLMNANSYEVVEKTYIKQHIPKFSQIIYVCSELAKHESARAVRIAAITCVMAVARVQNDSDLSDIMLRSHCASMFMFFLPGLSSTFTEIALEDQKVGHRLITLALEAFGKIVSLVMQDYNASDQRIDLRENFSELVKASGLKVKLKDKKEIEEYLDTTVRNPEWYRLTDGNLNIQLKKLRKLTYHSHGKVRREMALMSRDIVMKCSRTMPQSVSTLLEFIIILSEDSEKEVTEPSLSVIEQFNHNLSNLCYQSVFENLEDGFYNVVSSLTRAFNSIDDMEKVACLNLIIGYVKLFGGHRLHQLLLSPNMLQSLLENLLHILEYETKNVSLLEEYTLKDLSSEVTFKQPWNNFRHFKKDSVILKLNSLCEHLAKQDVFEVICDCLMDKFRYEEAKKKETTYLLNALIPGLGANFGKHMLLIKGILNLYMEDCVNDLALSLDTEEFSLEEVQNNVIICCLITEGVGKVSQVLKIEFRPFLLKALYLVLEKAGSGHPLIKAAGLQTLHNLTLSCGYTDITNLICSNFDFFSFQVQKKLAKLEDKEGVLNVLSIVLQYCSEDILCPMKYIIEEILLLSCDKYKERYATGYLRVFKMFVLSLRRWYNVEVKLDKIKTRAEKEADCENFKVSGIDYSNNFTDDIMESKSAEELYREDVEHKNDEEENDEAAICDEDLVKPRSPTQVELASLILKRSLHFLASKDQSRRLLVLEILENGVELLRGWDDELLPVVHQIWSPLVQRFLGDSDALTMRKSIRLLTTLARLSREFIRARVTKELLAKFKDILEKSAKLSYVQDKGAAYRYSQQYKLQVELLSSVGYILYYLDVDDKVIAAVMESAKAYLSDKQPRQLQGIAIAFYKMMADYDKEVVKLHIDTIRNIGIEEYNKNVNLIDEYLKRLAAKR